MPEQVESAIVASEVRSCLVLGRRLPAEMPAEARAQFMSGLWAMARQNDPALADMLRSPAVSTPVDVETRMVLGAGENFREVSARVIRQWMDQLLPRMSQPCYRMFAFPSHAMLRGERYDFVFLVLGFGTREGSPAPAGGERVPVAKQPWWRFW